MPRACEGCGFYADAPAGPCPDCGRPLKFTLLARPGEAPAPMAGVPTGRTGLGDNPEIAESEHATGVSILSGYVRSTYRVPLLLAVGLSVFLLIARVVTTR